MLTTVITSYPQPLPDLREGRQSVALALWGSSDLISNQADMILLLVGCATRAPQALGGQDVHPTRLDDLFVESPLPITSL